MDEKEYADRIVYLEDRIENYRLLHEYQERVLVEQETDRIYSRLFGLIDRFLKPLVIALFTVNESYEFDLSKVSDKAWEDDIRKEFDHQVDEEIVPWILNSHKTSIVEPGI